MRSKADRPAAVLRAVEGTLPSYNDISNFSRDPLLRSADDLEVEDGLLKRTEEPQPDGQQHLGAPGGGDVSQVDDVGPAEASEQLSHHGLGLRVVAAYKHGVICCGKLSGIDHQVGVHGV